MSTQPRRATVDVSALPTNAYGYRSLPWWATVAFMAIEGTTLVVCAFTYLYLRKDWSALPLERVAVPGLTASTVEVALMLASFIPIHLLSKAAGARELGAVRVWLTVGVAFNLAFIVLRWFGLMQLHVRWDTNAYGSAAWLVLVTHGTLLVAEACEIGVMAAMAWAGHWEEKHFSDAADMALYWYFMVLSWIPLWAMVFLLPRVA